MPTSSRYAPFHRRLWAHAWKPFTWRTAATCIRLRGHPPAHCPDLRPQEFAMEIASSETFVRWRHRATHWYGMFAGTSYYHQPQNTGRLFTPGLLKGYFNDLTGKTRWNGHSDHKNLPISKL